MKSLKPKTRSFKRVWMPHLMAIIALALFATGCTTPRQKIEYPLPSVPDYRVLEELDIQYKLPHERIKHLEKVGWKSEGITAQYAYQVRQEILRNARLGEAAPQLRNNQRKRCITMNDAWKIFQVEWLPKLARPKDEEYRYNSFIKPQFGKIQLDKITTLDLENYRTELYAKNYSVSTINLVFADIRRIYNKMSIWDKYSGFSPFVNFKIQKPDNARVRYLTKPEAAKLMAILKKRSILCWRRAAVCLITGMRPSEIDALEWSDIDFETNTIHVRDAKTGTRIAYFDNQLKDIFLELRDESTGHGLLFPTKYGEQRKPSSRLPIFDKVIKELGFNEGIADSRQKVVFYTLRHTFASWLVISGVDLYSVKELMGHSSIEITQRYAHLCHVGNRNIINKHGASFQL